jgi:integrase/recombinase XerD
MKSGQRETGKKVKKAKYNIYYLSLEEVNKIIDAAQNLRESVILKILARTGMRRFELANLRVKDVDIEGKKIFIQRGKNGKPRAVPVDDDTIQTIKFYVGARKHGKLIQSNNKTHDGIDVSRINAIIRKAAEQAGVQNPDPMRKHMNPHIFRHSFVRNMIKLGMPPNYVQQVVGHSDIRITLQMYGIPSFMDVQEKYQELIENFYK